MKKTLILGAIALSCFTTSYAGGILTNTNQSARFARLMALEASTKPDAAYYNPAGTIRLSEGFHFTFSNQSAFQKRIIKSNSPLYAGSGGSTYREYEGTASAPIIPSLQGVYRKGKWALSGSLAVTGGGGKATFEDGLPMFESAAAAVPGVFTQLNSTLGALPTPTPISISSKGYTIDQYMTGSNFIYGAQLGGAYEINDKFSAYVGFRLNIVNNKYEGYIKGLTTNITSTGLSQPPLGLPDYNGMEMVSPELVLGQVAGLLEANGAPAETVNNLRLLSKAGSVEGARLESKQSGWGVAPILGMHFAHNGLNIGVKYEFKTALNVENKTKIDDTGMFRNGVNTAHDIPALLSMGVSYDIIKPVTVNVGYHHFFDKSAGMSNDKQKALSGGTNEYLFGVEWRIDKMFLISMGSQITRYGVTDGFQSDLSFSVNSYSLGFGGAVNVSQNVQINAGYFYTDYTNYKMADEKIAEGIFSSKDYTRKNKVFTVGVDFSF